MKPTATKKLGTKKGTKDDSIHSAIHAQAERMKYFKWKAEEKQKEPKPNPSDFEVAKEKKKSLKDDDHLIDINLKNLDPERLRAFPGEASVYRDVDTGVKFALAWPQNDFVFVTVEQGQDFTDDIIRAAALSVRPGASRGTGNMKNGAVAYHALAQDQDGKLLDASMALLDNAKDYQPDPIWYKCYCNEPKVGDFTKKPPEGFTRCGSCNNDFHTQCIVESEGPPPGRWWACSPCNLSTSGVEWGAGGITNTCPFDGFGTSLLVATEQKELEKVFPKDQAHEALKTTLAHFRKKQYGLGHVHWNNFLRKQPEAATYLRPAKNDMHGNEYDVFRRYLKNGSTLTRYKKCTNDRCKRQPKQIQMTEISLTTGERDAKALVLAMNEQVLPNLCNQCHSGNVMYSEVTIEGPVPWMVVIDTDDSVANGTHLIQLPDEINISGHTFEKASITISGGDHFTSLIRHNNTWLYYDSIKPAGEKIRVAVPSDYANKTAASAYYFRQI